MSDRREIEILFEQALELPESDRDAWLAGLPDREVAARVESLLRAHGRAEGVLDGSAGPGAFARGRGDPLLERIGPYRIIEELGHGGMGQVYLARREDAFMRRVALKVVRTGASSSDVIERFDAERQIMASLNHPNIAQLLDGGVDEAGRPYLVMEYVEGLPITEYCHREGLTLEERLRLFRKVCAAVEHAHRNLVIHRDLKPSNVLVTMDGEPKLLDFGVARVLHPVVSPLASASTGPDAPQMTLAYASPEQLRGEPLTTESDVYALGVLLYELLCGQRPFGDPLDTQAMTAAASGREPEPPSKGLEPASAKQIRGDLDAIVLTALRREPGRRYTSVDQMSADIQAWLVGDPVSARGGGRSYRARKFIGRHRLEVTAAVLVMVSLVGGLGVALRQVRVARAERDRANEAAARAQATSDFLVGLYESGSLGDVGADTLSARAMLTRGLEEAGTLDGVPEVQARLYRVVGRAYVRLGDYVAAEAALRRAQELAARHSTPSGPDEIRDLARGEAEHAEVLVRLGRYPEAWEHATNALRLRESTFGASDADVATSLVQLGQMAVYFGRLAEADSLVRKGLEVRREVLGPGDPMTVNALAALASILRRRGEVEEAEALLREAMKRRRESDGPEARSYGIAMVRLGNLLSEDRGRHEEAEAFYRRALEIYADGDPEVGSTLGYLGEVLASQGRYDEAARALERAVEVRRSLFGSHHDAVAGALYALGDLRLQSGDPDAAEAAQREALSIWTEVLGPEHVSVAYALGGLAEVMAARGSYAEAEVLARRALTIREAGLAPENLLIPETEALLAGVLMAKGDRSEAERLLLRALGEMREQLPDDHRDVRAVHARLAELYEAWGKGEEAARHRAAAAGPPPAPPSAQPA